MSADEYASKELQQWRKAEAAKDIEAIKTAYCRHKALTTMKDEGIIDHINYID